MITKEDIKLVNDVDEWAQEYNRAIDREMSSFYNIADNTDNGWESVAESSPATFYRVLALAIDYKHLL